MIALYIQSASVATFGVLGLVSSTTTACLLGMDSSLLHSGLYGYNGILVGLCLATFHRSSEADGGAGVVWAAVLIVPVILYSAFSTLLFASRKKRE